MTTQEPTTEPVSDSDSMPTSTSSPPAEDSEPRRTQRTRRRPQRYGIDV